MLKSIRLVNFYSFRDSTIELNNGANVLVGINGSGKSNFFKAFDLLNEAINGKGLRRHILELGGVNEILFQGEREHDEISIELTNEENIRIENIDSINLYNYKLTIIPTQTEYFLNEKLSYNSNIIYERIGASVIFPFKEDLDTDFILELDYKNKYSFNVLNHFLRNLSIFFNLDTRQESKMRKPSIAIPEQRLSSDGSNLTQVLNTIKINDRKSYNNIIEALKAVNPNFKNLDFRPFGTNFEMLLEEEGLNRSMHISKVSDGTLRYLCLMTILLNPLKGFVCIDEPEMGLHPDMLLNLANAIKQAAETQQIFISTHSAQLLNYFSIEEVRVFEKDEDNTTQVYAYEEKDFKGWYETFQVGNMWRQGDIGGNRYGS
jgi:predicted ATPase